MPPTEPPLSLVILPIISCRRSLQPTPPTMSALAVLQWAMARSVTSASMQKMVSCSEKQRSSLVKSRSLMPLLTTLRLLMSLRLKSSSGFFVAAISSWICFLSGSLRTTRSST